MSWILIGVIFTLVHTNHHRTTVDRLIGQQAFGVAATPIPPNAPYLKPINPYIRHWEAAHFDANIISDAHQRYEVQRRRQKRSINDTVRTSSDTYPTDSIKFQFFAHNREFRVVLRRDPSSVFSTNVEIENTSGPIYYDTSRVYTGTLEDNDDAIVHGILTENNLFDGSIITPTDSYYIEPSSRYSTQLLKNGIHSIVYKTSDVHMLPKRAKQSAASHPARRHGHCASQRLHEKMQRANSDSVIDGHLKRNRRWLEDEAADSRDPPLPLDLDAPYNDDFSILSRSANSDIIATKSSDQWKNVLITNYNAKTNEYTLRNMSRNVANTNASSGGGDGGGAAGGHVDAAGTSDHGTSGPKNDTNIRPSHKTHVEIITKNGATKKPNIIGANYNPDIILTRNNFHHHHHHAPHTSTANGNGLSAMGHIDPKSTYERKSTCMLYLQADHTFFERMGSEEASIEAITRHVQRANTIYRNTDFNGDGKVDNITFMIKRIKIHTSNALKDTNYRFHGNYGVEKFLELFSEEDYDAFCLAYMFTYRDFEMGTLGLAWTGDMKNAGGVCEKNGHYRGSLKSLNTGIVTLLNYGKHVPPAVSHVTLAHEIGHNFGSPHDPEQCTPGGEDGNFIMFARATSGDKKNNNKFSSCSLKSIEPVLNSKARSPKGCFTEPQQAICGNGVVDPGEECDCGWEEDCKDSCCFPMSTNPLLDEKPCTLTPKARCSPSQGPCCTTACELRFGDKCREDNGCRDPSFCDGQSALCPASVNKPNKTICNKEFVCFMGECTGSICLAYGLESCQCIPKPDDPKTKACELCCKLPGEESTCKSSFEWNDKPYDVPDMYAKPGTPCNDYNGYCDVFQKCREVDPAGPLATLRRLLLSEEAVESFKRWISSNWFIVTFLIVGIVALLIFITRYFGKEIAGKNKSVTIIHSATTETVRLPDNNNGVIVHAAIRTKVPLKKKVRGERTKTKRAAASTSKTAKADGQVNDASAAKATKRTTATKSAAAAAAAAAKKSTKKPSDRLDKEPRSRNPITSTLAKVKQKSKPKKSKEVIDYANRTAMDEAKMTAFGKVQQWLLDSPTVEPIPSSSSSSSANATKEEQPDKLRPIAKSQSQQHSLSMGPQRPPKKVKSLSNLNEKVKLQVVYKPPFRLSLKLSTNPTVKTRVAQPSAAHTTSQADASRVRRNSRLDKNRKLATATDKKRSRTALLLPMKSNPTGFDNDLVGFKLKSSHRRPEDRQRLMPAERKQDSLDSKYSNEASGSGSSTANRKSEPIDSSTFRVSKSYSGANVPAEVSSGGGQAAGGVDARAIARRNSVLQSKRSNADQLASDYGKEPTSRKSTPN